MIKNEKCASKAEMLMAELMASKKAYACFIQADIYPRKQAYFEQTYRQKTDFTNTLRKEFDAVGLHTDVSLPKIVNPIFESMEREVLNGELSDTQLNTLIAYSEEKLVGCYQELLFYDLPHSTASLLQSQAEVLNVQLHDLKIDHHIARPKLKKPIIV